MQGVVIAEILLSEPGFGRPDIVSRADESRGLVHIDDNDTIERGAEFAPNSLELWQQLRKQSLFSGVEAGKAFDANALAGDRIDEIHFNERPGFDVGNNAGAVQEDGLSTISGTLTASDHDQGATADWQIQGNAVELHKRFLTFVDKFNAVGSNLARLNKSFNEAVGSAQSRLLPQGKRFAELAGQNNDTKLNDAIESVVREIQTGE